MSHTISLDELLALNQEIAALARVGAPLEPGLRAFARESPGRLGHVAAALSDRLASGKSLSEATGQLAGVPPVYAAVLEAGVRSGRLPAALEALADMARRLSQLRHSANLALAYPVSVLLLTYLLLLFFLGKIAPSLAQTFEDDYRRTPALEGLRNFFEWLTQAGQWLAHWSWVPPLVLAVTISFWWWQASRSLIVEPRFGFRWLGWIPWFGSLLRYSQLAVFTETLGLLIKNGLPLPESVLLAAHATGGRRLSRAASQVSQAIQQGASPAGALRKCGLPPLISWLLSASTAQSDLPGTLRLLAEDYQQRATYQAEKINLFLPVILTACVAGVAVGIYALMLFLPWAIALRELSGP